MSNFRFATVGRSLDEPRFRAWAQRAASCGSAVVTSARAALDVGEKVGFLAVAIFLCWLLVQIGHRVGDQDRDETIRSARSIADTNRENARLLAEIRAREAKLDRRIFLLERRYEFLPERRGLIEATKNDGRR